MNKPITEELLEVLSNNGNPIRRGYNKEYITKRGYGHLIPKIIELYPHQPFQEACKAIINCVTEQSYCKTCGTPILSWDKIKKKWRMYCSDHCRETDPTISERHIAMWKTITNMDEIVARRLQTNIEKYGGPTPASNPDIAKKLGESISLAKKNKPKDAVQKSADQCRKTKMGDYAFSCLESKEWVIEEYTNKEKSIEQISFELCVSWSAVDHVIKKYGIEKHENVVGYDQKKPGAFYVIVADSMVDSFVGFGISNYPDSRDSVHKFFLGHGGYTHTRILLLEYNDGKDAFNLEKKIKTHFKKVLYNTGISGFRREALKINMKDELMKFIEMNK